MLSIWTNLKFCFGDETSFQKDKNLDLKLTTRVADDKMKPNWMNLFLIA